MSTRIRVAGLAVGSALLLSACGSLTHPVTGAATAGSSAPSASATPSAGATSSTAAQPPMDSGDPTPPPTTPPAPVGQAGRDAADLAQAAMTAYQVTGPISPDNWYNRIAPYLLPDVRRDYSYTDPVRIRVHQLLGLATVTRQTDYLATVTQDTNDGVYTILEARDDTGQLKVSAITPPEGSGS